MRFERTAIVTINCRLKVAICNKVLPYFCTFFVLKHCSTEIFIGLDIYMVLHIVPCGINIQFCLYNTFLYFLLAIMYTLLEFTDKIDC